MRIYRIIMAAIVFTLITGCGSDNVLTKEEIATQSKADTAVSELLFESGLDTQASYNVHKDGSVKIEFVKSVSMIDYTLIVEKLRAHKHIKSVDAEQAGSAVCIMR